MAGMIMQAIRQIWPASRQKPIIRFIRRERDGSLVVGASRVADAATGGESFALDHESNFFSPSRNIPSHV